MSEIRPIRQDEAETFLNLLCDVFGLDHGRARGIFFSEPLFDLRRKWALFEAGEMVSILTTTALEFGWGRVFGVAGVATRADRQGEGLASKLLTEVVRTGATSGETGALLFARETGLYERNGFLALDQVVRAPVATEPEGRLPASFDHDQVRGIYSEWAASDPNRLRRDDRRWQYWAWHYRVCSPFRDGYLCAEPGVLREAIFSRPTDALPLPQGAEWLGTATMANELAIPFARHPAHELYLMGHNIPAVPRMFMTDQF